MEDNYDFQYHGRQDGVNFGIRRAIPVSDLRLVVIKGPLNEGIK